MPNPYLIEGPAVISFSGGRTSGYMLKQIVDAYGGKLPANVIPIFSNTGKEAPQTLDFVRDCGERWGVNIIWLEFDPDGEKKRKFRIVTHETASRDGEPYEALIQQRQYLPNPVARFCTEILKIRVMRDYAFSLGWDSWTNVVGLRYDEPRRVAKIKAAKDRWEIATPLHDARATKQTITDFWGRQSFDLGLENVNGKTPAGNCDLCFLKSAGTISGLIRGNPELADWWIKMESLQLSSKPSGARFRNDRPGYAQIKATVLAQDDMDFGERDELAECFCTE